MGGDSTTPFIRIGTDDPAARALPFRSNASRGCPSMGARRLFCGALGKRVGSRGSGSHWRWRDIRNSGRISMHLAASGFDPVFSREDITCLSAALSDPLSARTALHPPFDPRSNRIGRRGASAACKVEASEWPSRSALRWILVEKPPRKGLAPHAPFCACSRDMSPHQSAVEHLNQSPRSAQPRRRLEEHLEGS